MPDTRQHRGQHPDDARLFSTALLPALRAAVREYSWLLTHGYAAQSALKLVGDRHRLRARQRAAVRRCSCSDQARENRARKLCDGAGEGSAPLLVDGYNVLITVESALSKGLLFHARDGCVRDLASLHGTYRTVEETLPAIEVIGDALEAGRFAPVTWYLDAPVSNSGRLGKLLRDVAAGRGWNWSVRLVQDPDRHLARSQETVATSDSWILDRCAAWTHLARGIVESRVDGPRLLRLGET